MFKIFDLRSISRVFLYLMTSALLVFLSKELKAQVTEEKIREFYMKKITDENKVEKLKQHYFLLKKILTLYPLCNESQNVLRNDLRCFEFDYHLRGAGLLTQSQFEISQIQLDRICFQIKKSSFTFEALLFLSISCQKHLNEIEKMDIYRGEAVE